MSEPHDVRHTARILVALDDSSDGLAALEVAALLAAGIRAEIQGLFIEDDNLIRAAGLPFTHEISVHSALRHPLTVTGLERQLTSVANQIRDELERTARRAQVHWSFEVARGPVLRVTLDHARYADLIIIGRHCLAPRSQPIRSARQTPPVKRPILVLFDDSEASTRILEAAASLARDRHVPLDIYVVAAPSAPAAQLQAAAVSELARQSVIGHVHPGPLETSQALLAVARRRRPQLILLNAECRILNEETLETLVADHDFPVALGR
jgi:nucleotide-binding universal stress UspA family protein